MKTAAPPAPLALTPPPRSLAIREFFDHDVRAGCRRFAELEARIPADSQPHDDVLLEEITGVIRELLDGCERLEETIGEDPALLGEAKTRFREAIRPWFERSWLMHRATVKPRGYPGDFETLTAIYDGKPMSLGLAGYLDRYFLTTELGEAVPARLRAVRKFLCETTAARPGLSILNVACGPGREYDEEFFRCCRVADLTVVDTDPDALAATRARFANGGAGVSLNCIRHSALKMTSVPRNRELFGRPDLIYSVGLCDYIPDRYLVKILSGWRETLAEGGLVYVAFKDVRRYRPAVYQWLVDWNFHERTAPDCVNLLLQAGFAEEDLHASRDETGVMINFIAAARRTEPVPAGPPAAV